MFELQLILKPSADKHSMIRDAVRRAGIATALMEKALAEAPRLGLATSLEFIFARNEPSVSLCKKFGFEQWGHPRVAMLAGIERDLLVFGRRVA